MMPTRSQINNVIYFYFSIIIYTNIIITKSTRKDKKLMAIIDNKKIIHFGATGYEDFTTHKDEKRKQNYITRHKKNENWTDPHTPGFYAKTFYGTSLLYKHQ